MPVDLDDGAIDESVLEIGVLGEDVEYPIENPSQGPPAEALPHRAPFAELWRQVAPWRPSPHQPQHGFDKQPIVLARATRITFLAGKKRRYPRPLLVTQHCTLQGCFPFSSLESSPLLLG